MISLLFFYRKRAFEKDKDRYFFAYSEETDGQQSAPIYVLQGKLDVLETAGG